MFNIALISGVILFVILSLSAFLKFKRYEKQFGESSAGVLDRKDIMEILRPGIFFIIIAFAAFCIYFKFRHADVATSGDQSFMKFIQNVQSGQQQLTTDKAIAIIRQGRITENAYQKLIAVQAWNIQWIGWMALIGALLNVFAVFRLRGRSKRTMPDSTL
jgi:hypothetical protein